MNINDSIEHAAWDLEIIENSLINGLNLELIKVPDIDNDPIRMAQLALQNVRTALEKKSEELRGLSRELAEKENAVNVA